MDKPVFGLWGMAVMGRNLALNIESKGFPVVVYNRTTARTEEFIAGEAAGKNIKGAVTVEEFVRSMDPPRKVMFMVKAGPAVDGVIEQVKPYLEPGDVIIDGGNSFFKDTIRRCKEAEKEGLLYIGTGVSGGEEGALLGPAIMPGGSKKGWEAIEPIFTKVAAQVDGDPCCSYIGPDGAGHYVKMVHNGIEYGDMQLICEAYYLMANALDMSAKEMHEVFTEWNKGELSSYLIEITADILSKKDPDTGKPLVDVILDKAGQKGTGKWTSQSALDLGVPAPTIAEAVFARCMSAVKDERVAAAQKLRGPKRKFRGDKKKFLEQIRRALYASKVCSYAQGFALMTAAAAEFGWKLDLGEISMIWRGGCIIRAQFLHLIRDAFTKRRKKPANLLMDRFFKRIVVKAQPAWRNVVVQATKLGIPVPAFSSALAYFDSYRRERLSANMIQAQRDYFGAHTYQRVDKEGAFHTDWLNV